MRRVSILVVALVLVVPGTSPGGGVFRPHARDAEAYARSRSGSVAFAVIDETGHIQGFNRHAQVPSASVIKAMFLAAYLRRPSVRDRALRDSERSLLAPMIKRSDNASATRVADIVGPDAMYRLARAAGMRAFSYTRPWGESLVTARDQARFFYDYDGYVPERHERYARYLLSHVIESQRWGLARYIDVKLPEWKLYFKGGWGSGSGAVDHQVAFIERGGRRLALAVMTTSNPSHDYGNETLRVVTKKLLRGLE